MKLAKNVGGIDKVLRLAVGAVAMGAGAYTGMWWMVGVGAIIFLTGLLGRCGFYYLMGVNTCPVEKR
jgi:ABC-type protease/lipase transport system fused ATPase/permease subunit